MDHRRVQRALFRMQLDPRFAERLRARESEAVASAALGAEELALVAGADPAGVSADRDGKRRAQFLRNVTSEFALSLAVAAEPGLVEAFPESREFHGAVARDASLPLAFARWLEKRAARATALLRALCTLESALAAARRSRRPGPSLVAGEVALAPWAELVRVAEGTLDAAARVRAALDRGEPTPIGVAVSSAELETLLLQRAPEPEPFRLPEVAVELLSPELAALLARAAKPLDPAALAVHGRGAGVSQADLAEVVAGLVAARILIAG
ncbi:MAG TPA: hypothetical protein VKF60_11685 [Myxococcota bacterium]|nr:hypothetical protein [Myxococcota bacterium]